MTVMGVGSCRLKHKYPALLTAKKTNSMSLDLVEIDESWSLDKRCTNVRSFSVLPDHELLWVR